MGRNEISPRSSKSGWWARPVETRGRRSRLQDILDQQAVQLGKQPSRRTTETPPPGYLRHSETSSPHGGGGLPLIDLAQRGARRIRLASGSATAPSLLGP
jgi:hypothetical protein